MIHFVTRVRTTVAHNPSWGKTPALAQNIREDVKKDAHGDF
jgi:hypothetical protein